MKIGVIGGGAAGFFFAINYAQNHPNSDITIYEQSKDVLQKVRISGGGRCNVTHGCWTPKELVQYYPRGHKELLGPFHTFACGDTMEWFDSRGVALKIEEDGRVFPESNSSQSIIDCLMDQCKKEKIKIKTKHKVKDLEHLGNDGWALTFDHKIEQVDTLFIAPGSSPFFWKILKKLGHHIVPPVPSLFTFKIKSKYIDRLPGISVPNAEISIKNSKLNESGPLLITHWGLSGPAILKLSAWGALDLHERGYSFEIIVDWIPHIAEEDIIEHKTKFGSKMVLGKPEFNLPSRLWKSLLVDLHLEKKRWGDLNKIEITSISNRLKALSLKVEGKSTFKEEFVTAGGIDLKEINFKNFSSKLYPNLFFAGEVLNIDAVTGGFNFQAAWTGAYLAAIHS